MQKIKFFYYKLNLQITITFGHSFLFSSRSIFKTNFSSNTRCNRSGGALGASQKGAAEGNAVREEFELHQKKATPAPDVGEEVPTTPLGPGTPEPHFKIKI